MNKILFFFFILTFCPSCAYPSITVENPEGKLDTVDFLSSGRIWLDSLCSETFRGRKLGSEGNRMAFDYICEILREMDYAPQCQSAEIKEGITLRNIIVSVPGRTDSTIVIGALFDGAGYSDSVTHYPGANDNGSGTVTLLLFLKSLKVDPIKTDKTLVCCFWDGEENYDGVALRGSTLYTERASESFLKQILFYHNLDTVGHDHEGNIYLGYWGGDRMEKMVSILMNNGRFSYHKLEVSKFNSDYAPFYYCGIPFINYHDHFGFKCDHPNHSSGDTSDAVSIERLVKMMYNVRESVEIYGKESCY